VWTRPRLQRLLRAFFTLSMASLPASLASPTALCTAPFSWSTLPLVSSFLLPVTRPANPSLYLLHLSRP
jgi:hypothetical protein